MPQASAAARRLGQRAAAAPNTYSDSGGAGLERSARRYRGMTILGLARCSFVPAVPAIQFGWLIPRRDVPLVRARVRTLLGTGLSGSWFLQGGNWPRAAQWQSRTCPEYE